MACSADGDVDLSSDLTPENRSSMVSPSASLLQGELPRGCHLRHSLSEEKDLGRKSWLGDSPSPHLETKAQDSALY